MRAHTRRARNVVVVPLFTLVLDACATAMRSPESSVIDRAQQKGAHNTISSEELSSTRALTTVEALTRLRPEFLRGSTRTPPIGTPEIAVYLNNSYAGDVSTLALIPLDVVREIAFLHPTEAHMRFGSVCACANGAIVVTLQRPE